VTETKVQTIVEFERGSDPIRGQIVKSDTGSQPFIGWLGLLGLLERVASATGEQPEITGGVP
jgi:hypothetical protein